MKKLLLSTVDKWGPLAVSVIALALLCIIGWWYGERISKIEGQQSAIIQAPTILHNEVVELRRDIKQRDNDINNLRAWVIAVYERADANGWKLPIVPEAVSNSAVNNNGSNKKGKKK